jgi:lysozyme family protein
VTPFESAIAFLLGPDIEGGYVNDPRDPGGETKFGISKRAYPDLDIRNLSREAAIEIYERDYWDACRCDEFPAWIAVAVFDCAVNQGIAAAGTILQRLARVKPDGIIGRVTVAAVRTRPPQLIDYLAARALRYAQTKNFSTYGRGWIRRLFLLQEHIMKGLA